MTQYLVGLDVGSTTVKGVALDAETDQVLWRSYQRHGTSQAEKVLEFLQELEGCLAIRSGNCRLFFTGSGAPHLADLVGAKFVQEVHAVSLAVEKLHPQAHTVIELGGQDSKMILFQEQASSRARRKIFSMNGKCAGGTGAVIDRIASKLKVSTQVLSSLRYQGTQVHPVAGKCGVFAETDINSLRMQGIPTPELMISLFHGIVTQNLTVLTRGHTLYPQVLLLGGPHTFLPGLVEAWQQVLPQLWRERGVSIPEEMRGEELIWAPEHAHYFGAQGAAEFGRVEETDCGHFLGTQALEEYLVQGRLNRKVLSGKPALVRSAQELEDFLEKYRTPAFSPSSFTRGQRLSAFLGIDGGSTTTKAVLLSEEDSVLSKAYKVSRGNPIQDMIDVLKEVQEPVEEQGARLEVLGVGTTGYAKDILKDLIQADVALVETVAHAQAATKYFQDPGVIVDVGGQDIKLIILKNGHVKDFLLNSQCSAGNGYFLQATAEGLGLPLEQYAEAAFSASHMPVFRCGCAVFLQADIVDFQGQGWNPEEILAGLAAVLPQNIWLYVARIPNPPNLGRRFVLQGGTQRNLAAVKAQVDFLQQCFQGSGQEPQILVHPHCGEAAAIGAALEAQRLWRQGRVSRFIGMDQVGQIRYHTTCSEDTRCYFCKNRCSRTFIDIQLGAALCEGAVPLGAIQGDSPRRVIVATCEKGCVEKVESMRTIKARLDHVKKTTPNLAELAACEVWKSRKPSRVADPPPGPAWSRKARRRVDVMARRPSLRIGMPRVLGFYQFAPLFSAYFESLGLCPSNLIYSDYTNETMYREGGSRGSIDPCFPAKVSNAHVHNLIQVKHLQKPLDCIFFPIVVGLPSHLKNIRGSCACCTVSATPETVKAAFTQEKDVFAEHGIRYLSPVMDLSDPQLFSRQMYEAWEPFLGLSLGENERAVAQAFQALHGFEAEIRGKGREVIEMLERERRLGIVVLGRPYHTDPGLNHGILEELQMLGYPILTQGTLPLDQELLDRLFGEEVRAGTISHALDITDVWWNVYSTNSSHKLWAAKFTARHPNLVALEISNFSCGHDAPIYAICEKIVEASGTPFFSFRDLDENKPTGSLKIRIETIHYFLTQHRERLLAQARGALHAPQPSSVPRSWSFL